MVRGFAWYRVAARATHAAQPVGGVQENRHHGAKHVVRGERHGRHFNLLHYIMFMFYTTTKVEVVVGRGGGGEGGGGVRVVEVEMDAVFLVVVHLRGAMDEHRW